MELKGEFSNADVISRSVAKDYSNQSFEANIIGANICNGHAECDAIIMDQARVLSIPKLDARHVEQCLFMKQQLAKSPVSSNKTHDFGINGKRGGRMHCKRILEIDPIDRK